MADYWYKFYVGWCPVCGYESVDKERVHDRPKPDDAEYQERCERIKVIVKELDYRPKRAGTYSDEGAYNCETDKFDRRAIRVWCPNCRREASPLCSPNCASYNFDWRWVGLDYQQPETDYYALCPGCRLWYSFTLCTPQ